VVFDQLAHAGARRSRRTTVDDINTWEPGSAMSLVVIHALPWYVRRSLRAQRCGIGRTGVWVYGCMYRRMATRQIGRARLDWDGNGMGSGGLVFRRETERLLLLLLQAGRRNAGSRVEVMRVMRGNGLLG
jgi:hypothetical protein